jgi:hypothetical protein
MVGIFLFPHIGVERYAFFDVKRSLVALRSEKSASIQKFSQKNISTLLLKPYAFQFFIIFFNNLEIKRKKALAFLRMTTHFENISS